jgi:hypothetical protein
MAEAHTHFRAVLHTQIHLEHRRAQSRGYAAARDWCVIMEDSSTAPAFCVLCGPVSRCRSLAAAPGTKEQATFCPVALPGSMGRPPCRRTRPWYPLHSSHTATVRLCTYSDLIQTCVCCSPIDTEVTFPRDSVHSLHS